MQESKIVSMVISLVTKRIRFSGMKLAVAGAVICVASLAEMPSAISGELLPFPNEAAPQKTAPRYISSFREEISQLNCGELNELNKRLTDTMKNSNDNKDIVYYGELVKVLDELKRSKCF